MIFRLWRNKRWQNSGQCGKINKEVCKYALPGRNEVARNEFYGRIQFLVGR